MLDQRTIDIVKSTAPLLKTQGEALTHHFYQRMFSHNPEVKPLFNPAHQADHLQQRALADAIIHYAANIDHLEKLDKTVTTIIHKHASLQIKAEHYPIVGENLLASIKEVLGDDVATDEVIAAWTTAYHFLADILIGEEQQIYQANQQKPGGWQGFRLFTVTAKEKESDLITSFYIKPTDEAPLPDYLPGQYITLRLPTDNGSTTLRNYSLSDRPGKNYFRISVKREQSNSDFPGYVSHKLHQQIQIGDHVEVGPPCGEFTLSRNADVSRPLVLLAGGIGITPLLSILLTALEQSSERKIIFVHACLTPQVQAFKTELDSLARQYPQLTVHHCYSQLSQTTAENSSAGFITETFLDSLLPSRQADYYFCGPEGFMAYIYHLLHQWEIPSQQIHFEFFGPKQKLEASPVITH